MAHVREYSGRKWVRGAGTGQRSTLEVREWEITHRSASAGCSFSRWMCSILEIDDGQLGGFMVSWMEEWSSEMCSA
jgi:hypothetical protein